MHINGQYIRLINVLCLMKTQQTFDNVTFTELWLGCDKGFHHNNPIGCILFMARITLLKVENSFVCFSEYQAEILFNLFLQTMIYQFLSNTLDLLVIPSLHARRYIYIYCIYIYIIYT